MEKHPIENIMMTTMESIRDMVDVDTIIGEAIATPDGSTVIPISRVSFGFVAGGGEYGAAGEKTAAERSGGETRPFAGGTGAGVSVQPMGFLVVNEDQVKMLPAQYYAPIDRMIELVPQVLVEVKKWLANKAEKEECPGE